MIHRFYVLSHNAPNSFFIHYIFLRDFGRKTPKFGPKSHFFFGRKTANFGNATVGAVVLRNAAAP